MRNMKKLETFEYGNPLELQLKYAITSLIREARSDTYSRALDDDLDKRIRALVEIVIHDSLKT